MSEISRFYGIIIYIFYREHQPSHFHAIYSEHEALISIDSLAVLHGHLPPRALGLVIEWATIYQKELKKIWRQAMEHKKLNKIEPLK